MNAGCSRNQNNCFFFLCRQKLENNKYRSTLATETDGKSDALPKVVVFDLDGCVWEPEMYELCGGAPFTVKKNGNLEVKIGQNKKIKVQKLFRKPIF